MVGAVQNTSVAVTEESRWMDRAGQVWEVTSVSTEVGIHRCDNYLVIPVAQELREYTTI